MAAARILWVTEYVKFNTNNYFFVYLFFNFAYCIIVRGIIGIGAVLQRSLNHSFIVVNCGDIQLL